MPVVRKLCACIVLAAAWTLPQQPGPVPDGPPPVELPFDRVKPDATFDLAEVSSIDAATDRVWTLSAPASSLVAIDPDTNVGGPPVALGGSPCGAMAAEFGAVWVPLCGDRRLARVDVKTSAVTHTALAGLSAPAGSTTAGVGSIWVLADERGTLLRIDPDNGAAVADVSVPRGSAAAAFGMKAIWVAAPAANQVVRINAYTNLIEKTVTAGQSPRAIAVGDGAIWVLSEGDGTVVRLDPATNRTAATIDVGRASAGGWIAVGEGSVWVSARGAPLVRIDPRTNRVAQRFAGEAGGPLAVGHRSLWIAVSDATVWRVDPRFVAALR
jgi:streptogramin lyase